MFGRRKKGEEDPVKTGPYRVEGPLIGNRQLQNTLNKLDAEGYDMVWVLQGTVGGANAGREVIFKRRTEGDVG